jgi:hypothetical protein
MLKILSATGIANATARSTCMNGDDAHQSEGPARPSTILAGRSRPSYSSQGG